MHAQTSAATSCARSKPFVHYKSKQRQENRLRYRAQVATLCDQLAAAELSGTALRLALSTIARLIRRGSTTEAMPIAEIAAQLGVHRNAVSAGYASLEEAGILKRVAVKHRGAPTRTRLVGVAADLIGGSTPVLSKAIGQTDGESAVVPAQVVTTPSMPAEKPGDLVIGISAGEGPAVADTCTVRYTNGAGPDAIHEVAPAMPDTHEAAPAASAPGRFVFDRTINQAMIAKVPAEARARAMQAKHPSDVPVDLSWGLTEREVEHFRALVPKPEKPVAPRRQQPAARTLPIASPELTQALSALMPRIQLATGSTAQAFAVADQIAFSVISRGLGQGNALAGARAAVKMLEAKRWGEPRGYASERDYWSGIAMRSLVSAVPDAPCHAQKSVH